MSAVVGPTLNSNGTGSSAPAAKASVSVSNKSNNSMSASSVLAEKKPRLNGNQVTSPETVDMNDTGSNNTDPRPPQGSRSEVSNEKSYPLPPEIQRILGEVARTGSCSWLPWNISLTKDKEGHSASVVAVPVASSGTFAFASSNGKSTPSPVSNNASLKYAMVSRMPHTNRLGASGFAGAGVAKSPGKKTNNGRKRSHMRRQGWGSRTQTGTSSGATRKRPYLLIRTSPAGSTPAGVFSPGSVGSGRTSGSEPDDSTQYECDSEGTSATSCSELSAERRDHRLRNMQWIATQASKTPPPSALGDAMTSQSEYHCLRDVVRIAIGLVLDHWYRHKGGYKLSPAEKQQTNTAAFCTETARPISHSLAHVLDNGNNSGTHNALDNDLKTEPQTDRTDSVTTNAQNGNEMPLLDALQSKDVDLFSVAAEQVFRQRRHRLVCMLGGKGDETQSKVSSSHILYGEEDGPPFTIQRIAEVLIAPERYYSQTHKLCNCLEKLLLVTSSTSAFGGSTGGVTAQSRLEEREIAALASEKERLESEFHQKELKRQHLLLSNDVAHDAGSWGHGIPSRSERHPANDSPESMPDDKETESSSRKMLEAAARSLRTKFDHVGIDPHSSAIADRDVRSIAENRSMTNSPPPPSLAMSVAAAASSIALTGHAGVGSFVRHHLPEQNADHQLIARVPSPIFSQANDATSMNQIHAPPNMQLLPIHHGHAVPLAGVSMSSTLFDVVTIGAGREGPSHPNSMNLAGTIGGADLEGRSSASNSDVDSESDDVSFDDSASDRSDGSDSGHLEPFTAARAMALNRIQQHQQRLQSRGLLTSLVLHQSDGGFRPPADSEYQSGDSIDSTRGEDSGGSDSSSSDFAD